MKNRSALATGLTALALVAAGCGGDDDETTTKSETGASGATGATGQSGSSAGVLPADFIAEADAICEEEGAEVEEAASELIEPTAKEQAEFVESTVIPSIQSQIDALGRLEEPAEGADELEAFLDDAQAALDELAADPESFIAGDDPFEDVNDQAAKLGFEECGTG